MTYIAPVIVVCVRLSVNTRCEFTILHNTLLQTEMI